MREVGELFEFKDIIFVAENYEKNDSKHQCEECDLNVDGRKLCLNNECHCGTCGCTYDPHGRALVFKRVNVTNEELEKWKNKELKEHINLLKRRIETLTKEKTELGKQNMQLRDKVSKLEHQLKHIYAHITTAIKKEVYKNFM